MHAQPSSGARCLIFGQTLRVPYFMCVNNEGTGKTAQMLRVAWAFAGRLCDKYHNLVHWLNCIVPLFHQKIISYTPNSPNWDRLFSWILGTCSPEKNEPSHDKTNKMIVPPVKTRISLGFCPVWSESSLSAWRKLGSLAAHWKQAKMLVRLDGCPGWSESLLGTVILLVFSWDGSLMPLFPKTWQRTPL